MQIFDADIKGVKILQPTIFNDERGLFFESHNQKILNQHNIDVSFVQDNESHSEIGVLRGLHFQTNEYAQAKLIRVISGKIQDIALDLRTSSPSFGKYISIILDSKEKKQLYIPKGFAHGFVALEDNTIIQYKCDNYYNKAAESGILYNDPNLDIKWQMPKELIKINTRDASFPTLEQYINSI